MKKLVALILTFALIFSILPAGVFAQDGAADPGYYFKDTYVYDFMCNENGIYEYYMLPIVHIDSEGETYESYPEIFRRDENYDFGYGDVSFADTQNSARWVVGNTYPVSYGENRTFNVEVLPSPVVDFEVDDINFCVYYSDSQRYNYGPTYTVYYADGSSTVNSCELYNEEYGFGYDYSPDFVDKQDEEAWVLGETYEVTGSFAGQSDTFNVKVVCAEDIIAEGPVHIEGNGELCGYWDEDTENYIENAWMEYNPRPENIQIKFTDGTEFSGSWYDLDRSVDYWAWYSSDQSYDQPWGVGEHTATVGIGELTREYTVVVEETPVASLEIENISIMEYTCGYMAEDFWYYEPELGNIVITMKDGTVNTDGYLSIGDYNYGIDVHTSVQYDEHWIAGNTYTVTASILGVSDTFEVTILEGPVASLEIEDVTIIEGDASYQGDGQWHYHIEGVNAKVTLRDGTELTVSDDREVLIGEQWCYIEVNADSQYEENWTAGNTYTATARLLGVSDEFNVKIQPTPVKSIAFEDLVLIEGIDSYSYGDFEEYEVSPMLSEVVMKDGSTPKIYGNSIGYNDGYYWVGHNAWDMQNRQPWTPGHTYQITGFLLGVEAPINVTILENPIRNIELVKAPDQRECLVGAYPNLKGATIRIHYTDNTYEDVVFSDDFTAGYARSIYSKKLNRRCYINGVYAFETAGQQTAELELFGHSVAIAYNVKENKMQSLTLRENGDKTITVSVQNSDNTGFDMNIKDLCAVWYMEDNYYQTGIFTEQGLFQAVVMADDSSFTLALIIGEENVVVSNTIGASEWFEVMKYMQDHPLYYMADIKTATKNYSGKITADNIETVIEIAGLLDGVFYEAEGIVDADGRYYEMISGGKIRNAVKKYFAVENVDLSLSKYYNKQTDVYKHYDLLQGAGEIRTIGPDPVSYKDGTWTIDSSVEMEDGELLVLQMTLDSQQKIRSYSIGDGSVFKDIATTSWQYQAAKYALDNNLMAGKGTDEYGRVKFDPNSPITREEFVQVLYNAEDKPTVNVTNQFPDVGNSAWYKNAVLWAKENNIANGLGDGSFGVGKNITRQDLALMLYKYAALKGLDLTAPAGQINQYADGSRVSGYAQTAMNWAVKNGVLSGKGTAGKPLSTFKLDPAGTATRAECAAMLKNFMTAFNQ